MLIENIKVGKVSISDDEALGLDYVASFTFRNEVSQVFVTQSSIARLRSFDTLEERQKYPSVAVGQTPTRNQFLIDLLVEAQDRGFSVLYIEVVKG